ncbi:MAG TPA: hypothetical protein ACFYD6_13615 [Candidatus Brocadiia bacterium]|nr:hypothetical protein [Candidatus Brocadiales bacterium]
MKKEKGPPDELESAKPMEGATGNYVSKVEIVGEVKGKADVQVGRSAAPQTKDQPLWVAIRNRQKAISFGNYKEFIDKVLCERLDNPESGIPSLNEKSAECPSPGGAGKKAKRQLDELYVPIHGVGAYELLKTATEAFLLLKCGVAIIGTEEYMRNSENWETMIIDEATGTKVKVDWTKKLFESEKEAIRLGKGEQVNSETLLEYMKRKLGEYLQLGESKLPYIDRVIKAAFPDEEFVNLPYCYGILTAKAFCPCLLELIWSYWHEEGMLVQSLNAISMRFQNKRLRATGGDPLAHIELDPLRPLNNILWGYIQEEQHRLTVPRRTYEYDHHYGLRLYGKAVSDLQPADSRSKFLEAFHNLLYRCSAFFKEDDNTMVISDAYPVLNALKEVHLLLAQGAHNQFGDLPWTARVEMLIQQWIMARPEIRDFLQSRAMVPYKEDWMPQVDTMKKLQGWTDTTVTHFGDLGVFGEQILLSIRYGDWIDVTDQMQAKNWARYWRPEIQGYIHGYRIVTGVDLTLKLVKGEAVDSTMPSVHLSKRLALQQQKV